MTQIEAELSLKLCARYWPAVPTFWVAISTIVKIVAMLNWCLILVKVVSAPPAAPGP